VVLIGLMGAGKSSVGRRLARRLALPFVDADDEIERAAGCSIAELFERFGEASFREGERRVIARLLAGERKVLATGGGAFMDPLTRERVGRQGLSIWLRADLEVLVRRTTGREGRPLLKTGDPRETLALLMMKRYPVYAMADMVVDTADEPVETTVATILAALERWSLRPMPSSEAVS
jgi:shikimate kinase